jgi:hypothetical protein
MKPKNFSKKLKLNKKTIASLNTGEMGVAYGGVTPPTLYLATCRPNFTCPNATVLICCIVDP